MNRSHRHHAWSADKKNIKNWKQLIIPLALITVLIVVGRLVDVDRYLVIVQQEMRQLGPWGPLAYIGIYVIATLLMLPSIPLTIIAAFLFGTLWGYLTVIGATTLAATTAFFIARYLARDSMERRFAGVAAFDKVQHMVENNSWLVILFLRLMPIFPFSINDYALGLSRVPFWTYLIASEIIFIPMNAVLVFGAQTIYRALIMGQASWELLAATSGAALLVLGLGYLGKKYLPNAGDDHMDESHKVNEHRGEEHKDSSIN